MLKSGPTTLDSDSESQKCWAFPLLTHQEYFSLLNAMQVSKIPDKHQHLEVANSWQESFQVLMYFPEIIFNPRNQQTLWAAFILLSKRITQKQRLTKLSRFQNPSRTFTLSLSDLIFIYFGFLRQFETRLLLGRAPTDSDKWKGWVSTENFQPNRTKRNTVISFKKS